MVLLVVLEDDATPGRLRVAGTRGGTGVIFVQLWLLAEDKFLWGCLLKNGAYLVLCFSHLMGRGLLIGGVRSQSIQFRCSKGFQAMQ